MIARLALAWLFVGTAVPGQTVVEILGAPEINEPAGLAVDVMGNVYVAGRFSHNVVKVAPDGTAMSILEDDPRLASPRDLAVDAAGNVYVTGGTSDNVLKIDPEGVVTTLIDATGDGLGNGLDEPWGLAVGSGGTVFVAGKASDNVFRIEPGGAIQEILDASGDGLHPFDDPYELALDAAGNVYVTARSSSNVFRIDPGGTINEILDATGDGVHGLSNPHGIAVDVAGNVYVAGATSSNVFQIASDATIRQVLDELGDGQGNALCYPIGVAVDGAGHVLVSGTDTFNLFEIRPDGGITELLDSVGDGVGGPLESPEDVAVDACGNAYVLGVQSDNAFRVQRPATVADFVPGQRLAGSIDVADEIDGFSFYATAGTKLTLTARPRGKGNTLVPGFTITAPDGSVLGTSVAVGKGARVKQLAVGVTGLHEVRVTGAGGSAGAYRVKTRAKTPTRVNEIVEVGASGGSLLFEGIPGMTVKRLRVKALAPKGDFATVDGVAADLRPEVVFLSACGAPVTLGVFKTAKSGKTTAGKDVAQLTHAGVHRLALTGDGSVGFARVVARLTVPKGKGEVAED